MHPTSKPNSKGTYRAVFRPAPAKRYSRDRRTSRASHPTNPSISLSQHARRHQLGISLLFMRQHMHDILPGLLRLKWQRAPAEPPAAETEGQRSSAIAHVPIRWLVSVLTECALGGKRMWGRLEILGKRCGGRGRGMEVCSCDERRRACMRSSVRCHHHSAHRHLFIRQPGSSPELLCVQYRDCMPGQTATVRHLWTVGGRGPTVGG